MKPQTDGDFFFQCNDSERQWSEKTLLTTESMSLGSSQVK
jgi:hypothetical protein